MKNLASDYPNPYRRANQIARDVRATLAALPPKPASDPFAGIDYIDGDGSSAMPRPSAMLRADGGAS